MMAGLLAEIEDLEAQERVLVRMLERTGSAGVRSRLIVCRYALDSYRMLAGQPINQRSE